MYSGSFRIPTLAELLLLEGGWEVGKDLLYL
jgi:hypothetical protein